LGGGGVETASFFKRYDVNVMRQFDPASGTTYYRPEASAAMAAARATPVFQQFLHFNQYPRWSVTPAPDPEGGNRVEVLDLRLSFKAVAILDRENRVQRAWMQF
jgi:hypothetical protein